MILFAFDFRSEQVAFVIEAMSNNSSSQCDVNVVNAVNELIHRASEELLGE